MEHGDFAEKEDGDFAENIDGASLSLEFLILIVSVGGDGGAIFMFGFGVCCFGSFSILVLGSFNKGVGVSYVLLQVLSFQV